MDSIKLWPTLIALLLGGGIGFFVGRNTCPAPKAPVEKTKPAIPAADNEASPAVAETDGTDTGEPAGNETNDGTSDETTAEGNDEAPPTLPTLPIRNLCYTGDAQVSKDLTLFAERTEKQQLMYDKDNPDKLQDCSGIFHRIVQHVKSSCDGYKYPDPKEARDSRSLAKWFHGHNNFVVVNDAVAQRNQIKPGAVMFFGRSGNKYNDLNVDRLVDGIIFHIGVVTEVHTDDNGDVVGYVMMHGRRPGKHAQRSHYHKIAPPRAGFPPLGNWDQQWVGVAYVMTPTG